MAVPSKQGHKCCIVTKPQQTESHSYMYFDKPKEKCSPHIEQYHINAVPPKNQWYEYDVDETRTDTLTKHNGFRVLSKTYQSMQVPYHVGNFTHIGRFFFFVCQKITQMKKTGRGKQIVFIHLKIKILKGNWVSKYPVARKAYLGLWNRVFPQLSVERVTMTPFIWIKEGSIIIFGAISKNLGVKTLKNQRSKGVTKNHD